jgi:hypothetical protein
MNDQVVIPSANGSGITYNEIVIFACLVVTLLVIILVVALIVLWLVAKEPDRRSDEKSNH